MVWTHLKIIIITGISCTDIMPVITTVMVMVIMGFITFMQLIIIIIITCILWMDRIMCTHLKTHRRAQTSTDLKHLSRAPRFILPRCNASGAPRLGLLMHARMAALSCRTRRPKCKGE